MDNLVHVKTQLLDPYGLDEFKIEKVINTLMKPGIDTADLYFQYSSSESWVIEDSIVKEGLHNIEQGVGIRAISGEKTGFAYSDDLDFQSMLTSAKVASVIGSQGKVLLPAESKSIDLKALYQPINPLLQLQDDDKVRLLKAVDQYARTQDPRITQVIASINGIQDYVLIAGSDGTWASDIRPLVRLSVQIIVNDKGRIEQGNSGGGGRFSYQFFLQEDKYKHYVDEAVRQALVNLEAIETPAGMMTVVLGPGWPAVLLHEAVGHGLEGDFNRRGSSAFSNRLGEQVASKHCTIVDDGTLLDRRGSLTIDDEGIPSECTTLIEKGVLRGYMQDKHNAKLMKQPVTGNGRRESYAHLPMPRMTNTYMLPGDHEHDEIVSSVKKGLYAVNFGGGQVDITSGQFVFSANEAYLIEDGKIGAPVKGATIIGNGPEVLNQVSMVGNNLALDSGVGICGKNGQTVPVGVGQPTLKIDAMTVGGTQVE